MTDRLDTLISALERQAERAWSQLEATHSQLRALEAENRALRARLEAFERPAEAVSPSPLAEAEMPATLDGVRDELQVVAAGGEGGVATDVAAATPEVHDSAAPLTEPRLDDNDASERAQAVDETPPAPGQAAPSPQALLKQWYKRYPQTFFKGHTRPLQIGIHEQLAAREPWPDKLIKRALASYVNLPRYLKSVRAGALRVDLNGRDAEAVTEQDAKHAREQLKALQERQREREEQKASQRMAQKLSALVSKHGH